ELEFLLRGSPRLILAANDDRQIGREKAAAETTDQFEVVLEPIGVVAAEIIEKRAADAARFLAVRQVEVLIALFLERGVVVAAEAVANGFYLAVEVPRILLEKAIGRKVRTAPEP